MKTLQALLLVTLTLTTGHLYAKEKRCGWLVNPTPGNFWIDDRDGSWTIALQGEESDVLENLPEIDDSRGKYVRTNGYYGYTCACLDVETNKKTKRITRIYGGKQLPLQQCKSDKSLPKQE